MDPRNGVVRCQTGSFLGLSAVNHGVSVNEPVDMKWKLDLFAVDGKNIMHAAGQGSTAISLIKDKLIGNCFVIARLRIGVGEQVEKPAY